MNRDNETTELPLENLPELFGDEETIELPPEDLPAVRTEEETIAFLPEDLPEVAEEVRSPALSPTAEAWVELRQLLLGPEQSRLAALQERLEQLARQRQDTATVRRLLPRALESYIGRYPDLLRSVMPLIVTALQTSVRHEPRPFIEAMTPAVWPAMRRAMATALRGLVPSFVHRLLESLSLRTLGYRVEHVLLIQAGSGLLLQHSNAFQAYDDDSARISQALAVIHDKVWEALQGAGGAAVETCQVGEFTVWIEPGPQAFLAVAIRGTPPASLRTLLQETLTLLHQQHGAALAGATAESADVTQPLLAACLVGQAARSRAAKGAPLLWLLLILLCLGGGLWLWSGWRAHRQWDAYVQRLQSEPGIVVLSTTTQRGHYSIVGLRDPLSRPPEAFLPATIPVTQVESRWELYQALHAPFILTRAYQLLQPPETVRLSLQETTLVAAGTASQAWRTQARQLVGAVAGVTKWDDTYVLDPEAQRLKGLRTILAPPAAVTLRLEDGVLHVAGEAPHRWIKELQQRLPQLVGVQQIRDEQLLDSDMQTLLQSKGRIEGTLLRFLPNTVKWAPGQDEALAALAADVQVLLTAAQTLEKRVQVILYGHRDRSGMAVVPNWISQQRANYVRGLLIARGIDGAHLVIVGTRAKVRRWSVKGEEGKSSRYGVSCHVLVLDEDH